MYALSRREMRDPSFLGVNKASIVDGGLDLAENGGTLFTWGLVNGRFGVIAPFGVGLDFIIGLLVSSVSLLAPRLGGRYGHQLIHNVGQASLGAFLMRKGVQVGTSMRTAAGMPALAAADLGTGIFGSEFHRGVMGPHGNIVTSGGPPRDLSDQEIAAMVTAARR